MLAGPANTNQVVQQEYLQLSKIVLPLQLAINELILSPRGAWQLQLSNGILIKLGRDQIRQRFAQFVQLYPKIVGEREADVIQVDLRYPNGFAVQWRH